MSETKHDLIAAMVNPCATCRFWHREQPEYIYGDCRRWPPRARLMVYASNARAYERIEVNMQTSPTPEWPNTGKADGCGEHQARKMM